jgi:hypothetical protein
MARNTNVALTGGAWTQLTGGDVSAITFQNSCGPEIFVKATVGATPPEDLEGAIRYEFGQGERNAAIADLFPGISGANRVYAWSAKAGPVMVSHA